MVNSVILAVEAATFHAGSLRERPGELGEFVRPRLLAAYAYGPQAFVGAQRLRAELRRSLGAAWATVDALCTPSMPHAAPALGVPSSTAFTAPFNALGWPAVSVPARPSPDGLPLGVQLVAPPWEEATALRLAATVESALGRRQGPSP
jgi:aspartyl-tRNA(Asn)/glutamyl-tRNA(Gln) amidotransferase subunit A